jgi:drug/metabolite transporter (DMT)-like permease
VTTDALLGEGSCLLAASVWAVTVATFRRPIETFGARTINLAKCVISSALFLVTIAALGRGGALTAAPFRDVMLVALSGLVGLTAGDSALFAAVGRLGAYRALLLQTLAPVFTAIFALAWQREVPRGTHVLGMALTLLGVALVVAKRSGPDGAAPLASSRRTAGIVFGVLAAVGQGGGIVLAKAGMGTLPSLHASFVRLGTAAAGLLLLGLLDGTLRRARELSQAPPALGRVVPAAFMGSYVGIFLMMFGVGQAPAAVAAVLLSTTPVFSLFLDVARGRERFTLRAVAGTLTAIAGIAVLTQ